MQSLLLELVSFCTPCEIEELFAFLVDAVVVGPFDCLKLEKQPEFQLDPSFDIDLLLEFNDELVNGLRKLKYADGISEKKELFVDDVDDVDGELVKDDC